MRRVKTRTAKALLMDNVSCRNCLNFSMAINNSRVRQYCSHTGRTYQFDFVVRGDYDAIPIMKDIGAIDCGAWEIRTK